MATISEALTIADQYQRAGYLREAEQIYRQIVEADPTHIEARRNLEQVMKLQLGMLPATALSSSFPFLEGEGVGMRPRRPLEEAVVINQRAISIAQQGRLHEAEAEFRRVIQLDPDYAEAYNNLGNTLFYQGKLDEAAANYERALQLWPTFANAHCNLANIHKEQGKLDQAEAGYRHALKLSPHLPDAHNNLGTTLVEQGRLEEAEACYRQAVLLRPDFLEALNSLGDVLREQRRFEEALAICQHLLRLRPDYAEAYNTIGNTLKDQDKLEDALAQYQQALRLKPDMAQVHVNVGLVLALQGKPEEALESYRRSLYYKPNYAEAYNGMGTVLRDQGKMQESLVCYQKAVQLKPDYAEAHWNGALSYLALGNFEQGWPEYEWRWRCREFRKHKKDFPRPRWDGGDLRGRTILLHSEQGLGDTIQFIRYAALVKERGGHVIVQCQKRLMKLLAGCAGIDKLVPEGAELPHFDVHASLLSLPAILRTTFDTIPARVPYLTADPALVEDWRQEIAKSEKRLMAESKEQRAVSQNNTVAGSPLSVLRSPLKIGIAWQGNPEHKSDRERSIALGQFAPLARLEGVRLFSLQKGPGVDQLEAAGKHLGIIDLGSRLDEESGPFMDTAAVMQSLDLVIASDSAVGHLAGASGVPIWLVLAFVPDWRWMMDRDDSPWYPTMRLFRQKRMGDWGEVFERIVRELSVFSSRPSAQQLPAQE